MKYFRIPTFTGIEAHRDDADRGSLRIVEGCFPVGTGGLSSGPVWEQIATVDESKLSQDKNNYVSVKADSNDNSFLMCSRKGYVHDLLLLPEQRTILGELGNDLELYKPEGVNDQRKAYFNSIGNRTVMLSDGSTNPIAMGKGAPVKGDNTYEVVPDLSIYSQEYSEFKRCKYFVVGPGKSVFAAGSCLDPLSVYISEPAGLSTPSRDGLYSSNAISKVTILMSNATVITGLSLLGSQVIVHTDSGCHLLYQPKGTQASTGFRVEQKASSVISGAVSNAVVNRGTGPMPLWTGHDGHVYKDESATRGQDDQEKLGDRDQASYKSKGVFEQELPQDMSGSTAVYDASSGLYLYFVESKEYKAWQEYHNITPETEDPFVCPADEHIPDSDQEIINDPVATIEVDIEDVDDPNQPETAPIVHLCDELMEMNEGLKGKYEFQHNMTKETGWVSISPIAYFVPDAFSIIWDGEVVVDTGFITDNPFVDENGEPIVDEDGNAPETLDFHLEDGSTIPTNVSKKVYWFEKTKAEPEEITVIVDGPVDNTKWAYSLTCPSAERTSVPTASTTNVAKQLNVCRAYLGSNYEYITEQPNINYADLDAGSYQTEDFENVISGSIDLIIATEGTTVKITSRDDPAQVILEKTGPFALLNSDPLNLDSDTLIEDFLSDTSTIGNGRAFADEFNIPDDKFELIDMTVWPFYAYTQADDREDYDPPFEHVDIEIICPEPEPEPEPETEPEEEVAENFNDCLVGGQFFDFSNLWTNFGSDFRNVEPNVCELSHEIITCLCEVYNFQQHEEELQLILSQLKEINILSVVADLQGLPPGKGANGLYTGYNVSFSTGDYEGVLAMNITTIVGFGLKPPMKQFLETFRHESIHAAQDIEANLEGMEPHEAIPVGDDGVISNDHGYNEMRFGTYRNMDPDSVDWKMELEGNSVEIDKELRNLAWALIGERDQ